MRCSKLMFAATILFMISTVSALTNQQQTEKNTGSLPFSKVRVIVSHSTKQKMSSQGQRNRCNFFCSLVTNCLQTFRPTLISKTNNNTTRNIDAILKIPISYQFSFLWSLVKSSQRCLLWSSL